MKYSLLVIKYIVKRLKVNVFVGCDCSSNFINVVLFIADEHSFENSKI